MLVKSKKDTGDGDTFFYNPNTTWKKGGSQIKLNSFLHQNRNSNGVSFTEDIDTNETTNLGISREERRMNLSDNRILPGLPSIERDNSPSGGRKGSKDTPKKKEFFKLAGGALQKRQDAGTAVMKSGSSGNFWIAGNRSKPNLQKSVGGRVSEIEGALQKSTSMKLNNDRLSSNLVQDYIHKYSESGNNLSGIGKVGTSMDRDQSFVDYAAQQHQIKKKKVRNNFVVGYKPG